MTFRKVLLQFIFLLFLMPLLIVAQELPTVTPGNPETASLGRYGNTPINTATGRMSYSIPIHTINVDGNTWPISLGYSYGGLIAEAKPSLFGLGWGLNAYGAVNREVRGLPDGDENGYYGPNNIKDKIPNFTNGNWTKHDMDSEDFQKFKDGVYDSEVDKYTLNVGGMNFSFKLRFDTTLQKYVPYFLHENNYNLIVNMDTNAIHRVLSFEFTDDSGITYYFEDREVVYCEQAGNSLCTEDNVNSWLLSKVKYLNGEEITFEYSDVPQRYLVYNYSAAGNVVYLLIDQGLPTESLVPNGSAYADGGTQMEVDRLLLEKINFPEGTINFNHDDNGNRTLYQSIQVKNNDNDIINDFTINYQGNRDLLLSVDKNAQDFFDFEYYTTATGSIPAFHLSEANFPFDQDDWKFYNGANNTVAIHMGTGIYQADKSPDFVNTRLGAMKSIIYPTGGRTEITYQQNQVRERYTPGTSGSETPEFNNEVFVELNPTGINSERHIVQTVTITEPVVAQMEHFIEGDLAVGNYIRMSMLKVADYGTPYDAGGCYTSPPISHFWYPDVMSDARKKLRKPTVQNSECVFFPNPPITPDFFVEYGPDGCPYVNSNSQYGCQGQFEIDQSGSSEGFFTLLPGVYEIVITTNPHYGNPGDTGNVQWFSTGSLRSGLKLQWYQEPLDPNNDNAPRYIDKDVGGIRVASVKDIPVEGEDVVKTYEYTDDLDDSSGVLNHVPNESWVRYLTTLDTLSSDTYRREEYFNLNSFSFLNESNGIPVYYKKVKVISDNGGTITEYTNNLGNTRFQYPNLPHKSYQQPSIQTKTFTLKDRVTIEDEIIVNSIPINDSITISATESTTGYVYDNSPLVIASQESVPYRTGRIDVGYSGLTTYAGIYHDDAVVDKNADHPWSFKIKDKLDLIVNFANSDYPDPPVDANDIYWFKELYDIWPYKEVEYDSYTQSTSSITQELTQIQKLSYNDKRQLIKSETYTSEGDTIVSEYLYPYDTPVVSESQYQAMVVKNQISQPVMTISKKNGDILSTQKTNFVLVQNGYKPANVEVAKESSPLEERVVFEDYDSKGNIRQVRKSNGVPIAYLWGYGHKYPVAKIENATFLEANNAMDPQYNYTSSFQSLNEADLKAAVQSIRDNLPNALITSYTYKPLVGVTTVTDPRGYSMEYKYDSLNRLQYVVDKDGKVLSENQYNYKQ